nr:MAG TPA: hypothetical protein [Crassvirales sp.]
MIINYSLQPSPIKRCGKVITTPLWGMLQETKFCLITQYYY